MDDNTGICYTWSGDKKIYEPDLFKAELQVFGTEYCYRYDSANSYTLVFGKPSQDDDSSEPEFSTYLPYGDIHINHNIQDNGEDHYSLSGTYTKPGNWSPPAGLDGPFDYPNGLKYPHYAHTIVWADGVNTWYNGYYNGIGEHLVNGDTYWYGRKEIILPPPPTQHILFPVYLSLKILSLNGQQTISCECQPETDWIIPGTNNGNFRLEVRIQLTDGVDSSNDEVFYFSWIMKDGINESRSCRPIYPYYCSSAYFTTQSSWETDNEDGTKTYYDFDLTVHIPSPPSS